MAEDSVQCPVWVEVSPLQLVELWTSLVNTPGIALPTVFRSVFFQPTCAQFVAKDSNTSLQFSGAKWAMYSSPVLGPANTGRRSLPKPQPSSPQLSKTLMISQCWHLATVSQRPQFHTDCWSSVWNSCYRHFVWFSRCPLEEDTSFSIIILLNKTYIFLGKSTELKTKFS